MSAKQDVGLVGLGLMGTAIGTRLLAAGHTVVGFDPDEAARSAHLERGGEVAQSAAEVASRCRLVVLSLPNGQVTHQVCFGPDGLSEAAHEGLVVVDTSTILPQQAVEAAAGLAEVGVRFYDAGLSASSNLVARGEALGIVGGEAEDYPLVEEVLRPVCKEVMHVGGHGDGMRAKLVINLVLTINRFAIAEGLVFAEKLGMDGNQVLPVLQASIARSKAMDIWGQRMIDREYDPPNSRIRQHNKDAQLTLGLGREHGAPLLVTSQINHVVQTALANGYGDADNAAISEMLRMFAGVEPVVWPPEEPGR